MDNGNGGGIHPREFYEFKADVYTRLATTEAQASEALKSAERAHDTFKRLLWPILTAVLIAVLKGVGVV